MRSYRDSDPNCNDDVATLECHAACTWHGTQSCHISQTQLGHSTMCYHLSAPHTPEVNKQLLFVGFDVNDTFPPRRLTKGYVLLSREKTAQF